MGNRIAKSIMVVVIMSFFHFKEDVYAQELNLDNKITAGELTLYGNYNNPNQYYYLPDKVRIATGPDGKPQFSFLRYVDNSAATGIEGDGGGLVHVSVILDVTPEQLKAAERELQQINSSAKIMGALSYKGGTVALTSSIANAESGFTKQVIGLGSAPLMEGHKAAISVLLNKKGAKILWESFKTNAPNFSVNFDMNFIGYSMPKRITVKGEWENVYSNTTMQAAAAIHGPVLIGADISAAFKEMELSKSLIVDVKGDDEFLQKAYDMVFTKLVNMMFDPVGGTGSPTLDQLNTGGLGQTSLLDKATAALNAERKEATTRNDKLIQEEWSAEAERERLSKDVVTKADVTPPPKKDDKPDNTSLRDDVVTGPKTITKGSDEGKPTVDPDNPKKEKATVPTVSIMTGFQMKKERQKGSINFDFNKTSTVVQAVPFSENLGVKAAECPECFREVNLEDIINEIRVISARLDGPSSEDFDKYLNFVNLSIRKTHENGEITQREIPITKALFTSEANNFKFNYGWKGDNDRNKFYTYDYKVTWEYFGGFKREDDWQSKKTGAISLASPFLRKTIDIEADTDNFLENNIRACEVKVYFKLGDQEQMKTLKLTSKTNILTGQLEVLMPANDLKYEYEITWFQNDGSMKKSERLPGNSSLIIANFKTQ